MPTRTTKAAAVDRFTDLQRQGCMKPLRYARGPKPVSDEVFKARLAKAARERFASYGSHYFNDAAECGHCGFPAVVATRCSRCMGER